MSRIINTSKNFMFSIFSTLLTSLLGFISRTVFINIVGAAYLGANSLFTNILAMLSFTELGIGSAISFSLYRPLAVNDIETVKSLMQFYKKAYRWIAVTITVLGLCLLPFLNYLIKGGEGIEHIPFIYLVYLYNTVISYLFSYKATLLAADQKSYLMTRVNMIISVVNLLIQMLVLIVFRNYFAYLISGAVISTLQWYFINKYIYGRYPYLKDKNVKKLDGRELGTIKTNVKAMMFHKVGELCINQTDNIIISSFIDIVVVGLYNNYYMIISIINKFATSFFSAATASLGNLIATENEEKSHEIFKVYNFLGFWVYGWTAICLTILLTPFILVWLGSDFQIDNLTLMLVMLNYYLVGMRVTIGNVKMAAGLYAQDQWVPIAQSVINLVVSIWGSIHIGLAGVFLGTVVSSLAIPCWYRPIVVYKHVFKRSVKEYFAKYVQYFAVVVFCFALTLLIGSALLKILELTPFWALMLRACICAIVPNAVIILLYHRSDEFRQVKQIARSVIMKALRK